MRQWRLDTVRRLRELAERQSRVRLAHAVADEQSAADELSRRRADYGSRASFPGRLDAGQLRALHLQGVRSVELIEQAAETLRLAEERATVERLGWSQTASEAEAVQRLDERRRRESAELASRVSADALDDLVGLLRVLRPRS